MKEERKSWNPSVLLFLLVISLSAFPVSAQAPERDRTLIVDIDGGMVADPTNWNPFIIGVRRDQGFHQLITEYFFYYNWQSGLLTPWLATGYEYNEDYTSITVHLRKGVKWSDGEPFTADDVVFTYEMLLENAPRLDHSADVAGFVDEVVEIDDYTVEIKLKSPNLRFHLSWAFPTVAIWGGLPIVPKHIWKDVDPLTYKNSPPVFTGPYELVSASETTFTYKRRDDWWGWDVLGIRPAPEYVIYTWYGPEETRAIKMAGHELDAIMDISLGTFLTLRDKNPYVEAWHDDLPYAYVSAGCDRYMLINNLKYPWSLKEARWALSYLIDREEVVRVAYENTSAPLRTLMAEVPAITKWLDEIEDLFEIYPTREYNPDKATAIFESLGFTKGADGIWVTPNGTRLELSILTPAPWIEKRRMATVLVDQLTTGGVDTVMKIVEVGPFGDGIMTGTFDSAVLWYCPLGGFEPYSFLVLMHSKYWRPIGEATTGWHTNCERFKNATYDAIVDEMEQTPEDDPRYTELFREAMEIWLDNLPGIPITLSKKLIPFDTYYWTGWPTAKNPWFNPQAWHGHFLMPLTGIRPREVEYVRTYFAGKVPKFRGIDLEWYGPFVAGDSDMIPVDDAEFLVGRGYSVSTEAVAVATETVTQTVTQTTTETQAAQTVTQSVPTMDVTSVAGAGVVALVVGVAVGWLVGSRKRT